MGLPPRTWGGCTVPSPVSISKVTVQTEGRPQPQAQATVLPNVENGMEVSRECARSLGKWHAELVLPPPDGSS